MDAPHSTRRAGSTCGLTARTTTFAHFTTSAFDALTATPCSFPSSACRSGRGSEIRTWSFSTTFELRSPATSAPAMLPPPRKPMRVAFMFDLRFFASCEDRERLQCGSDLGGASTSDDARRQSVSRGHAGCHPDRLRSDSDGALDVRDPGVADVHRVAGGDAETFCGVLEDPRIGLLEREQPGVGDDLEVRAQPDLDEQLREAPLRVRHDAEAHPASRELLDQLLH